MKEIKSSQIEFTNDRLYLDGQMVANPCQFTSVEEIVTIIGNLYLVAEMGHGNSALINLVWAFDECEAVENAQIIEVENVCSIEEIKITD